MKRIYGFTLGLMLIALSVSCENEKLQPVAQQKQKLPDIEKIGQCCISSSSQKLEFSSDPSQSYSITADDWITVTQEPGKITLSFSENKGFKPRQGTVNIVNQTQKTNCPVPVIQDECIRSLRKIMRDNQDISIFYSALVSTHLIDETFDLWDVDYPSPSVDSTYYGYFHSGYSLRYRSGYEDVIFAYPDKRYLKHTVFAVPNSILAKRGINSVDDLNTFAKSVYPESNDALHDFLAYHMLPEWLPYDELNVTDKNLVNNREHWDELDNEDFYETLLPHSIMRISTPFTDQEHRYINRKGTEATNLEYTGILVTAPTDCEAVNGGYYLLDDILTYDDNVRSNVLNTRMRIFATTLSPDFMNRDNEMPTFRETETGNGYTKTVAFKQGFTRNWKMENDYSSFYVRQPNVQFSIFMGHEILIRGMFDFSFKLPPVPADGKYEIRMIVTPHNTSYYYSGGGCIAQSFIKEGSEGNWKDCLAPIDYSEAWSGPVVGMITDQDLENNGMSIDEFDRELRARGYMKAMDSYHSSTTSTLRDNEWAYRKILSTEYLKAGQDYYLRFRNIFDDPTSIMSLSIIELVPECVYDGEVAEDRH